MISPSQTKTKGKDAADALRHHAYPVVVHHGNQHQQHSKEDKNDSLKL